MRILSKELKKLFKPNLVIILLLFSAVYMLLFCNAWKFPNNWGNSQYDVPMYHELVKQFGSTVDEDELPELMQLKKNFIKELITYIKDDSIFAQAGIDSYEKFDEVYRKNFDELSETEQTAQEEAWRFWFDKEETSELLFRIQCIDVILYCEKEGYLFSDIKKANAFLEKNHGGASNIYKLRMTKIYTELPYSLLPIAAEDVLYSDQKVLIILAVIWCFVLILPFQITEQLRGVINITACTKTGKKIFCIQAAASVIGGVVSCILITAAYTLLLKYKGILFFMDCPISTTSVPKWFDLTAMQYYILQCCVLIIVTVSASVLAYLIGRVSSSYIMGLAIAIPTAAVLCAASAYSSYKMFSVKEFENILFISAFGRLLVGIVFVAVIIMMAIAVKLFRDRKSDI